MTGPGDLAVAAIECQERTFETWLREASENELVKRGICPACRYVGCAKCDELGTVESCKGCGAVVASARLIDGDFCAECMKEENEPCPQS